jgi:multiple sugar transport system permease protein
LLTSYRQPQALPVRSVAMESSAVRSLPQQEGPSLLARLVGANSPLQMRRALWGYVFLLPWILGLIIFWIGPILTSAWLSFTEYDVISAPRWVGLDNYQQAFFKDDLFWPSLGRTFLFSFLVVPLGLAGSLGLAMLLNRGLRGTTTFRTIYFIPHLTPVVALAILWSWLFHPTVGPVNAALGLVGIQGPAWLQSAQWALPAVIIISLWANWGGNAMLIFLAGLQGVPQELMDAAHIDGAGAWSRFTHITVPMISPTILFNLILGIISSLQVFTLAFVLTKGGPSYATWFYALHIYNNAFAYFKMGYGSALAWIFVVVLLVFTAFQLGLSRRWVYYGGE